MHPVSFRGRHMKYLVMIPIVMFILILSNFISGVSGSVVRNSFTEDFETGYDGWERTDGKIFFPRTQRFITYEGDYAFRMTSRGAQGYSGRIEHQIDIPLMPNTTFEFAYYFLWKRVSYVGYQIEFSDGKIGDYFSLFYGMFVNISVAYIVQYKVEASRAWHFHHVNLYDDYRNAFGSVPSDLRITSVSLIAGDPYFTQKFQTSYFDSIKITQENQRGDEL